MTSHQNIQFHKKIMIKDHQEDVKASGACELCLNKHAAWYCSFDDAFLCNVCDESVHSANQVATKHERICLRTNEILSDVVRGTTSKPVWHSGFRRKARTPRGHDDKRRRKREEPRVPEIRGEGMFLIPEKHDYHDDGNDDDLTSLVPEFQGFTDMGFFFSNDNGIEETTREFNFEDEIEAMEDLYNNEEGEAKPCLVSCKKDYDNVIGIITKTEEDYDSNNAKERNMLLRLNYENVIEAWDKQEFPREATRYQTKINNKSNFQLVPHGMMEKTVSSKSEREARVWRYKDKRKNRLFEKKIRYEVRKVNADKRPRMKGRFVRRSLTIDS